MSGVHWTPEEFEAYQRRQKQPPLSSSPAKPAGPPAPKGRMNKWERTFRLEVLDPMVRDGLCSRVAFEAVKLRLGANLHYTPDWCAWSGDGRLTFFEVKGFWRDDARVKIKAAAQQFPEHRFIAATKKHGAWQLEYIDPYL